MAVSAPLRLVVLISGNGSNLQAIIDAIQTDRLNATIAGVISDKKDAYGLERARQATIPAEYIPFTKRNLFEEQLLARLAHYQPDYIVLAGFMRILSTTIINPYHNRILNIHPSLLPKYKGLNTHQRVLEAGDPEHGATIHLVSETLDGGPILAQARLAVHPEDTPETLKERVQQLEHQLYPKILQELANDH